MSKISVIIPLYNCQKYIAQTLDNVIFQTHRDLEIIIVNDCSTDDSENIAKSYAAKDPRIQVISLPKNSGTSVAKNTGASAATGEYMHFMDADDLINVEFYERMLDAAHIADADISVCGCVHERLHKYDMTYQDRLIVSEPQDKFDMTRALQQGQMWRYLFRRDFWNKNQFHFPEGVRTIEDGITIPEIIYAANRIICVPGAVYIYKNRGGSLMNSYNRDMENNIAIEKAYIKEFMQKYKIRRGTNLIKTNKYRTLFNLMLLKTETYSTGRKVIYLFGIPILKIVTR